jgi:hypothetical protein
VPNFTNAELERIRQADRQDEQLGNLLPRVNAIDTRTQNHRVAIAVAYAVVIVTTSFLGWLIHETSPLAQTVVADKLETLATKDVLNTEIQKLRDDIRKCLATHAKDCP